jgi:hypothetical protein
MQSVSGTASKPPKKASLPSRVGVNVNGMSIG